MLDSDNRAGSFLSLREQGNMENGKVSSKYFTETCTVGCNIVLKRLKVIGLQQFSSYNVSVAYRRTCVFIAQCESCLLLHIRAKWQHTERRISF